MIMFIWRGVLTDYTHGIIVSCAPSLEEAKQTVLNVAEDWRREYLAAEMERVKPEERALPFAAWEYGGG